MYNDVKKESMKNSEEICKPHQTIIPFPDSHVFLVAVVVYFPLLFVAPDHFGAKVLKICSLYSTQMQFWYHFEFSSFSEGLPKVFFVGWGFTIPYARCMEYVPTNSPQIYGIHVWWIYQSHGAYGHGWKFQLKSLGGGFQIFF